MKKKVVRQPFFFLRPESLKSAWCPQVVLSGEVLLKNTYCDSGLEVALRSHSSPWVKSRKMVRDRVNKPDKEIWGSVSEISCFGWSPTHWPAILPSGSSNAHSSLPSPALEALTSLDERTTPWSQSASGEIMLDSALLSEILRFASYTSRIEVQRCSHPQRATLHLTFTQDHSSLHQKTRLGTSQIDNVEYCSPRGKSVCFPL